MTGKARKASFLCAVVLFGVLPTHGQGGERLFDPRTLRPSEEIVTPHIAWAKPAEEGVLRVLFVITQPRMREVVELSQRMDLDYSVFAVPRSGRSFNMPPLTETSFREDLEAKLAAMPQVIVVAVEKWTDLSLFQRYRVLKTVKGGVPLVTLEKGSDTYLTQAARHTVPVTLRALLPIGGLPAYSEYPAYDDFVRGTAEASTFGASTIHRLRSFEAAPPQILTPGRLDERRR